MSSPKKDVTRELRDEMSWRSSLIDQATEFLDQAEAQLDKKEAANVVITKPIIEACRQLIIDSRRHNQNIKHVITHELTVKRKPKKK